MSCIPSPNPQPPITALEATTTLLWFRASRVPIHWRHHRLFLTKSRSRSPAAPAGLRRRQPRGLYIRSAARPTFAAPPSRIALFTMFMSTVSIYMSHHHPPRHAIAPAPSRLRTAAPIQHAYAYLDGGRTHARTRLPAQLHTDTVPHRLDPDADRHTDTVQSASQQPTADSQPASPRAAPPPAPSPPLVTGMLSEWRAAQPVSPACRAQPSLPVRHVEHRVRRRAAFVVDRVPAGYAFVFGLGPDPDVLCLCPPRRPSSQRLRIEARWRSEYLCIFVSVNENGETGRDAGRYFGPASTRTMSDTAALRRQLKIKSGVTNRLKKELELYQKELVDQKIKTDKLIAAGAEEWDIKNSGKMTDESEKMIKDATERLAQAYHELRQLVVSAKENPDLAQDEDFLKAEGILEETAA
ncbi:tubulin binding cofactor A-domain-containing protein [Mycena sanguinolenta]|nr:tubulin binding cofactor A-domain-containing protein [Mycena sanguinolenta]